MYVTSRIVYLVRQTDGFCKQKSNCLSSKFEIRYLDIIRSDYIASQLYRHQVLVLDFAVAYLDRTDLSIRFQTVSTIISRVLDLPWASTFVSVLDENQNEPRKCFWRTVGGLRAFEALQSSFRRNLTSCSYLSILFSRILWFIFVLFCL